MKFKNYVSKLTIILLILIAVIGVTLSIVQHKSIYFIVTLISIITIEYLIANYILYRIDRKRKIVTINLQSGNIRKGDIIKTSSTGNPYIVVSCRDLGDTMTIKLIPYA